MFPPRKDIYDFDALHGTDTGKIIKVYRLDSVSSAYVHSHGYEACDIRRLSRDLMVPPIDRGGYEFIDLGCGKGRALIYAAEQGFGKVTGVEISPTLAAITRKNLGICGVEGEVIAGDAGSFVIPDNPCVIYLNDPFGKPVMKQVVSNVQKRLRRSVADLWVIYRSPVYPRLFELCPGLDTLELASDTAFFRSRVSAATV
jgi:predicted RNA methylase